MARVLHLAMALAMAMAMAMALVIVLALEMVLEMAMSMTNIYFLKEFEGEIAMIEKDHVTTNNVFIDLGFKIEEAEYLIDMSNILTEVLKFSKKYNFEKNEKLELKNILFKFLNNREREKNEI